MIKNEKDLLQMIRNDPYMMELLTTVQSLGLQDSWICAGVVRAVIWDRQHGYDERTVLDDVDVIYFDPEHTEEKEEVRFEAILKKKHPHVPWSVKNQARMHVKNGVPPYQSSTDAMSKFPETVTAIGLSLNDQGEVILVAPHGIKDVLDMVVRPTPPFKNTELSFIYERRILQKNWRKHWPRVEIRNSSDQLVNTGV